MDNDLKPTEFLDYLHPDVATFTKDVIREQKTDLDKVISLFYEVRDKFPYDPLGLELTRDGLRTSQIFIQKSGNCIQKAMLLAAACRYIGIPSRLQFFIVKNHLGIGKLKDVLKSDLIVFHGAAVIYLNGKWIKAVPAFNLTLCQKLGVDPIEFDGVTDAIFQQCDGKVSKDLFMEYVHDYGVHNDFPYEFAMGELKRHYPHLFTDAGPDQAKRIKL